MAFIAVEKAGSDDVQSLATMFAQAFIDEPALSWMVPDTDDRKRTFPNFFKAIVSGSMRNGLALHTQDNHAATLWRLPQRTSPSFLETLSGLPQMLPLLRLSGPRAKIMSRAVRMHWPKFPFRYLQFAGVAPSQQGMGMGGAVIRAGLELAKKAGDPVYLETAKPENAALYQSLGFEIIHEWEVENSPLLFRSMLKRS